LSQGEKMNFIERALPLLERGFSLIPLEKRGKAPQPGPWKGASHRTRDAALVTKWGELYPESNVAIVADENFLILDVDDLQNFQSKVGMPQPTLRQRSSSDNKAHFIYQQTDETRALNNIVAPGLFELRCKEYYVVGAGSVHPSGEVYRIVDGREPVPLDSSFLIRLRNAEGEARVVISRKVAAGEKVSTGERYFAFRTHLGQIWDGTQSDDELWEILQPWCDAHMDDYSDREGDFKRMIRDCVNQWEPNQAGPKVVIGETPKPQRWEALDRRVLLAQKIPLRMALLQDGDVPILFERSVNQIFAWRGVGKTNFALGIAGALASGGKILNFQAPKPSRVLYVDGELPAAQLQERIKAFTPESYDENVLCISPELLGLTRAFNFLDQADFDALCDVIERYRNTSHVGNAGTKIVSGPGRS
jgi:Bifunctional DNA primase/polymerase, N-terminal/AAA domain